MTGQPLVPDTAPWCAAPDPATRPPRSALPPGSCDCHAHICGPLARYPYAAARIYTLPDALLHDYRRMLATLGVQRAVLVQPSVYGTDNTVLLGALSEAGPSMRGVAVVDPGISDAELRALDQAGIRGVRINVVDRREGRNVVPLDDIVPSPGASNRSAGMWSFYCRSTRYPTWRRCCRRSRSMSCWAISATSTPARAAPPIQASRRCCA